MYSWFQIRNTTKSLMWISCAETSLLSSLQTKHFSGYLLQYNNNIWQKKATIDVIYIYALPMIMKTKRPNKNTYLLGLY